MEGNTIVADRVTNSEIVEMFNVNKNYVQQCIQGKRKFQGKYDIIVIGDCSKSSLFADEWNATVKPFRALQNQKAARRAVAR